MDVQTYMHGVGREARAASKLMAKADTDTKNRALTMMALARTSQSGSPSAERSVSTMPGVGS